MEKHYRISDVQLSTLIVLGIFTGAGAAVMLAGLAPPFIGLFTASGPVNWPEAGMAAVSIALFGAATSFGVVHLKRLRAEVAAAVVQEAQDAA